MSSQTKVCDACGQSVTYVGHRGFAEYHRTCPKRGTNAIDADHSACPTHGTLVWVIGPYSAFRACENRACTAGRRGKPWRYCAPRGEYSDRPSTPIEQTAQVIASDVHYSNPDDCVDPSIASPSTPAPNSTTDQESHVSASVAMPDKTAKALSALLESLTPSLDERKLASMVSAAVDAKLAERVQVTLVVDHKPSDTKIEIENSHPYLRRAIRLVEAGIAVYLWGPAGSGKTTAAMQIAKALHRDFEIDTLDPSTFRSMVQGYMTPTGEPVDTSFTRCWRSGKVYCADENDNAPGHVQTLFNSALANGHAPLAWGNVARADGFAFVGTGNTPGRPTREFPDRKPMSAAFMDRLYFMNWPLDEQSERAWSGIGGHGKRIEVRKTRAVTADAWVDFVQKLREWSRVNAPTLMITPRASLVGLKALACGESPDDVADGLIFRGADAELRAKAINAVGMP